MAHCTGYVMAGETGMTYCKGAPIAAYTWDGVPFNYKGKPGAAVCSGHEQQLKHEAPKYPGLVLVERIGKSDEIIHAFEKSGLGKAPFRFIGCEERRGPILLNSEGGVETWAGSPGQPMGTCAHCGTGIAVCCTIQSADGKQFVVGNVCVAKTGDKGLINVTRKAINARLADARRAKAQARFVWIKENLERARPALEKLPHPGGFSGKTAYDWAVWMAKNAGDAGRKDVEKKMLEALKDDDAAEGCFCKPGADCACKGGC